MQTRVQLVRGTPHPYSWKQKSVPAPSSHFLTLACSLVPTSTEVVSWLFSLTWLPSSGFAWPPPWRPPALPLKAAIQPSPSHGTRKPITKTLRYSRKDIFFQSDKKNRHNFDSLTPDCFCCVGWLFFFFFNLTIYGKRGQCPWLNGQVSRVLKIPVAHRLKITALRQWFSTMGGSVPKVHFAMSQALSGSHNWGVLLARCWPGMLLNSPQCTGQPPTTKKGLAQRVSSAEAERLSCAASSSWSRVFCAAFRGPLVPHPPPHTGFSPNCVDLTHHLLSLYLFWHDYVHKFGITQHGFHSQVYLSLWSEVPYLTFLMYFSLSVK